MDKIMILQKAWKIEDRLMCVGGWYVGVCVWVWFQSVYCILVMY